MAGSLGQPSESKLAYKFDTVELTVLCLKHTHTRDSALCILFDRFCLGLGVRGERNSHPTYVKIIYLFFNGAHD